MTDAIGHFLSAGGDLATMAIAVLLWRVRDRLLVLETKFAAHIENEDKILSGMENNKCGS